jgi:hypothetical protein
MTKGTILRPEANLPAHEEQSINTANRDGGGSREDWKKHGRAAMVCIAAMVLMGSIAASVAFAEPSTGGGGSAFDTFAASPDSLTDATVDAIPVTTPEPAGTALTPQELEDIGRPEAEGVLEEVFGSSLEGPAQALDELNVEEFRSDHVAVVAPPDGSEQSPAGLLSSLLPLRADNDNGEKELVDLDLQGVEGHLEPENPLFRNP